MAKRSAEQEAEFQKKYQALIEAVNDTEGMDPQAAEETKTVIMNLMQQAFEITE